MIVNVQSLVTLTANALYASRFKLIAPDVAVSCSSLVISFPLAVPTIEAFPTSASGSAIRRLLVSVNVIDSGTIVWSVSSITSTLTYC